MQVRVVPPSTRWMSHLDLYTPSGKETHPIYYRRRSNVHKCVFVLPVWLNMIPSMRTSYRTIFVNYYFYDGRIDIIIFNHLILFVRQFFSRKYKRMGKMYKDRKVTFLIFTMFRISKLKCT